jgi:glycerophosphoryl diester phosphodiesterase
MTWIHYDGCPIAKEPMPDTSRPLAGSRAAVSRLRESWKTLALTDLAWKLVAFVALTPLVALCFRAWMAVSGRTVASDQDLLQIFAPPFGVAILVVLAGMLLAIVALEQSALMAVLHAAAGGQRIAAGTALRFAIGHAWPVLRLTSRMVVATLLAVAPFAAALALLWIGLLGDHDINFYLKEKPPVFVVAAAAAAVVVLTLVGVLLRLFTGWLHALPLVLFEGIAPNRALGESRARVHGRRGVVLAWIASWALTVSACSVVATSAIVWPARAVVPTTAHSVSLLAVAIGTTLLAWFLAHLAVNLFGNISAAVAIFTLHRGSGGSEDRGSSLVTRFEREGPAWLVRVTRPGAGRWGLAAAFAALAIGAVAVHTARLDDTVKVAAHRGSSKAAPENSLSAMKQAIADGADWVELDVQETADGEIVVFHDSDFMKMAGVGTKVWDATLADVRAIDIGRGFSPAFAGEHAPTLADVLDACKGRVGVLVELKYYGHDTQLEEKVARLIDERGMAPQTAIMSLELDMVRKMKAVRPGWKVGLLMSVSAGDLRKTGADFLAVNAAFVSRRFVRQAHRNGLKVYAWTVDDPSTMSAMMGRGVDGLITNLPAVAKRVVAQRAALSPAVRLLLELADVLGVKPKIGEV